MRKARETDYWDKVYKRNFSVGLKKINLNGLNNLNEVTFSDGILALCGLNGAGKSTIISAIKAVLGIELSDVDTHKLNSCSVCGEFRNKSDIINCSNDSSNRLVDTGYSLEKFCFIDSSESVKYQNFNIRQSHLEELIEQSEEYEFSEEELTDINYLAGKKYTVCGVREFEEIDKIGTVPFFRVVVDEIEYDSRSMGSGEHFLFYLFWCINKGKEGTIYIIEEPETYISIYSQVHFSNYLGKKMAENGVQIIMTTHSPYLLGNIKNENIRIVSRMGNNAAIIQPNDNLSAEDILGIKGNNEGTLFVEDKVAYDFLSIILEDKVPFVLKKYPIDIAVGGEAAVSKRLEFAKSDKIKYSFIGVYDGDMRNRLDTSKLNWKWCFLPGENALEEIFRLYLHKEDNVVKICDYLGREKNEIITVLSTIDGHDYHDWFEEFRKYLGLDGKMLVRAFYKNMVFMEEEIDVFIKELKSCM